MFYVVTDLFQQGYYSERARDTEVRGVEEGGGKKGTERLNEGPRETGGQIQREGMKERKTIRRQMCASTDMLLLAS